MKCHYRGCSVEDPPLQIRANGETVLPICEEHAQQVVDAQKDKTKRIQIGQNPDEGGGSIQFTDIPGQMIVRHPRLVIWIEEVNS